MLLQLHNNCTKCYSLDPVIYNALSHNIQYSQLNKQAKKKPFRQWHIDKSFHLNPTKP